MLTALLTPRTYLINGKTFEVDQVLELTKTETKLLGQVANLTHDINGLRTRVFSGCWKGTKEVDADLSALYFEFEDQRIAHNTVTTKLLRGICRRLGGILPLHLRIAREPYQVVVRAQQKGEPVTIDRGLVKNGSLYSRAFGDIEAMLPVFMGTEDLTTIKASVTCVPEKWQEFGCPMVKIATATLGLDVQYADGLSSFLWTDHENIQLDRLVTLSLGRVLGQPGRLQSMQSRAHPFPMIATIVGPETALILNLSEANEDNDTYRLALLKRELGAVDGRFLSFSQFGPLEQRGSQVDMQDGPQQPLGITVTAVVRNDCSLLMGGKSWTIQQADPKGAPSLMTYGVFEDHPGLAGDAPQAVITRLFDDLIAAPTPLTLVPDPTAAPVASEEPSTKTATKKKKRYKKLAKKSDTGPHCQTTDPLAELGSD